MVNSHRETHKNATHTSTTNPDGRLSEGSRQEAKPADLGTCMRKVMEQMLG
jgi:hypothetical protein